MTVIHSNRLRAYSIQFMQVLRDIKEIEFNKRSHLTIGTFDGIHLGHQKIITDVVQSSDAEGLRSVLITFYPHPQMIVKSDRAPLQLLTPMDEKLEQLQQLKLDTVLIIPFSAELADTEPKVFVEKYLIKHIGVHHFSVGFDHAFGKDREGGESLLRELGKIHQFDVHIIPPVCMAGVKVSSTRIRHYLLEGQLDKANQFLGREYQLSGVVQKGQNLGEKLGFPTANISVTDPLKLVPRDGVYAVRIEIKQKKYQGMANIGTKPTVDGKYHGIEVHIHDFSGDLYNERLKIHFVERIRNEQQFESLEALRVQIKEDSKATRYVFAKHIRR